MPPSVSRTADTLSERRSKWESFWQRGRASSAATHLLAVELTLDLLRVEGCEARELRVLDLGCGDGQVLQLLETAFGGHLVGVDLAAGALVSARANLGSAARLVQGDAFSLGLATGVFDGVLSLGYASAGSYPGVQGEVARVLRPGGVALVDFRRMGLYHLPVALTRPRRVLAAWQRGEVSLPLLGFRPAPSWEAAGLRLEEVRLFNTYPPLGRPAGTTARLTFERRIGRRFAPLLARTMLAKFRRLGFANEGVAESEARFRTSRGGALA